MSDDRFYAALDVVAELLRRSAERRRQANRDLADEQREAQRGAREAYAEGQWAERERQGDW